MINQKAEEFRVAHRLHRDQLRLGCLNQVTEHVEVILLRRRERGAIEEPIDDRDSGIKFGLGAQRTQREPADQVQIPVLGLAVDPTDRRCPLVCHAQSSFHFPSSYSACVTTCRTNSLPRLKCITAISRDLFPPMSKTTNRP